jgi:hypothetical protein
LGDADSFRQDVQRLRRELGLRTDYEFKYRTTGGYLHRRRAFLRVAFRHPFRFAVSVVDKGIEGREGNAGVIHWAAAVDLAASLRQTLVANTPEPGAARWRPPREGVWVDDNEDATFLTVVKQKFRELGRLCQPPRQLVGPVRFAGSGPDEMIQLADVVCGAFRAMFEEGEREWYTLIRDRDLNLPPARGGRP